MDGLECSEIFLSKAISLTGEKRLDSEYYKKEFVTNQVVLESKKFSYFENYCNSVKKGIFDLSPSNYKAEGIPFIRTSEIRRPLTTFDTTVFIDKAIQTHEAKTALHPGDIVFTKIGANIGDIALLPNKYREYNFSQNVAGAVIKDKSYSSFLLAFFLTKHGHLQIIRSAMISGQGKIELAEIKKFEIPFLSSQFCSLCTKAVSEAENRMDDATNAYATALRALTLHLNFNSSLFSTEGVFQKRLSKSFGASGRLDAEYYQPKYDDLFALLDKLPTKALGKIVDMKKSIEPGSEVYGDEGIPFIRVSDVTTMGIDAPSIRIPRNVVPSIEELYPKKDTILFSKDGSVGIAYKVEEVIEAVTSGALLHFRVKRPDEILPDYLTLVLNSEIVQLQAERDASGAVIQHWKPGDITNVVIPMLPMDIQREISEQVQKSFVLRRQAEHLIDVAVRAVEIAIEQDEDAAIEFIRQNT